MIWELSPADYTPHPLHDSARDWPETNCYVDALIEVLHGLSLRVEACLPFTLRAAFEGDQWTFFKPRHSDLERLYGLEIEELTLWRPVLQHVQTQTALRRMPFVEVDSYFLPDTKGTDYRSAHVKTTIAIVAVDEARKQLRYFHNRGFYELSGADFDGVFRLDREVPAHELDPYCEIIKTERVQRLPEAELRAGSLALLREHFARRPENNPVRAYAEHFPRDLQLLLDGELEVYHRYSFAAVRQLGASFSLASACLRWLDDGDAGELAPAVESFAAISQQAKAMILKLARIANSKRPRDLSSSFQQMADAWDAGMDCIRSRLEP